MSGTNLQLQNRIHDKKESKSVVHRRLTDAPQKLCYHFRRLPQLLQRKIHLKWQARSADNKQLAKFFSSPLHPSPWMDLSRYPEGQMPTPPFGEARGGGRVEKSSLLESCESRFFSWFGVVMSRRNKASAQQPYNLRFGRPPLAARLHLKAECQLEAGDHFGLHRGKKPKAAVQRSLRLTRQFLFFQSMKHYLLMPLRDLPG
jgi:hypothetical protein